MPRPASGQVIERAGSGGRVLALRFHAYGQRQYATLGGAAEGWTRARAEAELQNVLADVRRGLWHPPTHQTVQPPQDPTFHEFASAWLAEISPGLRPNTRLDYCWQLTHHLLPFFAAHRLRDITVAEVDRYRAFKVAEGSLGATSINKTLTRLGQILDVAEERELIARNPMRVNRRRRKLRERRPTRTFLDRPEHIRALLDAAAALDDEARIDRRIPRRAMLATLTFAGLRLGEMLDLRWGDVDLEAGRLRVNVSKTDAGRREVDLLAALSAELSTLRAHREPAPQELLFATATGERQNPSNFRNRVLAASVRRADEQLAARGLAALPAGLTPHSLRRTFASLLFVIGRPAPEVMEQIGHTDARLTLGIYARSMRLSTADRASLIELVNGPGLGTKRHKTASGPPSKPIPRRPGSRRNIPHAATATDGRGWFRTSDLSRVKRALSR